MTTMTVPNTFLSEAAVGAAVDEAFADALAQELAAVFAPARQPIVLPDVDTLIAQAGIVTGPCPPDARNSSLTARAAKTGARLAGRATWWLIKGAVYVTAVVVRELATAVWHLLTAPPARPQLEEAHAQQPPLPSDFLEATSDEITRSGWTQFQLQSSRGVCVIGAERALLRASAATQDTAKRANDHLLAVTGARSLPTWNDRLTRSQDQIHAALLAAAARARAAGE